MFIMLFLLALPVVFTIWLIWLVWRREWATKTKALLTLSLVLSLVFPIILEYGTKEQWSTIVFVVVSELIIISLTVALWAKKTWGEAGIELKPAVKLSLTFPLMAGAVELVILLYYTVQ